MADVTIREVTYNIPVNVVRRYTATKLSLELDWSTMGRYTKALIIDFMIVLILMDIDV